MPLNPTKQQSFFLNDPLFLKKSEYFFTGHAISVFVVLNGGVILRLN